ncbi:MAG TPA: NAD(P)/FAD-dependent oxidoreductase [Gemmatimonadaceae bacterium]
MPDDAEVIVVGGGPAGATAAFFLARAGCDVLVVDRAFFPRDKPCSEYLSPQASRLLAEMGALDEIENGDSARLTGMRVTAPDGRAFAGSFAAVSGFRPWLDHGVALRRTRLDALLLSKATAAGARLTEGLAVRDLEHGAGGRITGVVAHDGRGPRVLRSRLLIGADGLRSVVARRAGLGAHGRWPRRLALVTHYRDVRLDADVGDMHVLPDGYAGFAPVGAGLTNVALVVPARRSVEFHGNTTGFMAAELGRHPRLASRLVHAERVSAVRAVGPFNWRARQAWRPGLALVGDAADFFDPFTGEGIYAAMRGAELLCGYAFEAARARSSRSADIALDAYDRCRRREFTGKWNVERIIAAAVASRSVMNLAARALSARPALADTLVGVTGDFVPANEVLRMRYILQLVAAAWTGGAVRQDPPLSPRFQLPD